MDDPAAARLTAPAATRNAPVIAATLLRLLGPEGGPVVEIGAGTGQHAVACARALPGRRWLPTDPDPLHLASIAAWRAEAGAPNLSAPLALDAAAAGAEDWTAVAEAAGGPADALYCANVIHIAPWAVAEGIVAGAARLLAPGGRMMLYGPFLIDGETAESNRAFDASLRARDQDWGVRELREVEALAAAAGFGPAEAHPMPANNHLVVVPRLGAAPPRG